MATFQNKVFPTTWITTGGPILSSRESEVHRASQSASSPIFGFAWKIYCTYFPDLLKWALFGFVPDQQNPYKTQCGSGHILRSPMHPVSTDCATSAACVCGNHLPYLGCVALSVHMGSRCTVKGRPGGSTVSLLCAPRARLAPIAYTHTRLFHTSLHLFALFRSDPGTTQDRPSSRCDESCAV